MHDHRYGMKGTFVCEKIYEYILASSMLNMLNIINDPMMLKYSSLIVPYTIEKTTIETRDS